MLDPNRTKIEEWCRLGFPVPSQARVIRSTRPGQLDSMKAKIKIIKSNNQPTTEPRNLWKKRDRAWLGQVNLVLGKARLLVLGSPGAGTPPSAQGVRGGVTGQQETLRDVRRKINRIRQCEQRGSNTRIVVGGHSVYH
ncbi:37_t:CDS:2 [Funneliformis geosporum]|nr:37_t:CDS:2 [Funneliformis geosporum]